ncbi:MAG: TrmH family RNA methyltransferase [Bacteroidales bacterium]|nr:TrmH family RNA methyltransferase [Bacteroidales bacterium]
MKDRKLTAAEMGRISPEEYRSRNGSGTVVVLDNVRSAYNVGSAFRSADAFGVSRVYLCGICAVPPSAEIHKTALGAEEAVPWQHFADTLEAVAALKAEGYTVVSVEQTENSVKLAAGGVPPEARATPGLCDRGSAPVTTPAAFSPSTTFVAESPGCGRAPEGALNPTAPHKYAFIFGNEVEGVQQAVVDASDFCLEIPQHGTKHSLNVSVTVGIVLWAFCRG